MILSGFETSHHILSPGLIDFANLLADVLNTVPFSDTFPLPILLLLLLGDLDLDMSLVATNLVELQPQRQSFFL